MGKRQEKEKKQGTRKKREKTGTGWKDKGMAVRTAERKKRKNCNYAIRLSLTAKSVAEEMGISRQQLCNIEQSETAPVVVEGIKGYDGKTISQYVKANFNQGRLDFYNENPDRKRDASQRNVVANSQRQEQGNRKSKGASIA